MVDLIGQRGIQIAQRIIGQCRQMNHRIEPVQV